MYEFDSHEKIKYKNKYTIWICVDIADTKMENVKKIEEIIFPVVVVLIFPEKTNTNILILIYAIEFAIKLWPLDCSKKNIDKKNEIEPKIKWNLDFDFLGKNRSLFLVWSSWFDLGNVWSFALEMKGNLVQNGEVKKLNIKPEKKLSANLKNKVFLSLIKACPMHTEVSYSKAGIIARWDSEWTESSIINKIY